ncbi:zinc-binding dehydrogenase [Altererythrobacter aerius]|uniref:Zinc-binding dehydrogenase n=1 Tax=Tsuneonella aeria TaxID=1837929 RepID=A0A6I4TAJ0_9SPHN|nr:NADP-dependent oxidoreductase [Tsuneonella aeria]MXO74331.1 zinc-binding dehydrogenase [Tsuneonella aeria]
MSGTMQAMVIDRFGEPDVFRLAEIERPTAGPGQVVIRVAWAGVNPADWKARRGWLAQYFDYRFPFVVGFDAAGTIAEVGAGVTSFAPGDRVVTASNQGLGENGTYAQFVRSDVDRVAHLPGACPMDLAAALPTAGITAFEALFDVGRLEPGQRVLVNGGAGGTGSFAIRLAREAGARVAATARAANHDYLRALGAECAIDYRSGDVAWAVRAWAGDDLALVVDTVGQGTLLDAVDWVRPGGTVAPIGTLIAGEPAHDARRAAARGVRVVPTIASFERQGRQLRALVERLADGAFDTIALTRMTLGQAAEAHRLVEEGHVRGKIVMEVS